MKRSKMVFVEVSKLYSTTTTSMGKWMWLNHTQWVADRAKKLAEKYDADVEKAYCAALVHDLGDSKYERGHTQFDAWSKKEGRRILLEAGFSEVEVLEILETAHTHSSKQGNLPTTQEGKVLATADGMWHLQTSFFPVICYMNRPENTKTYVEWQEWFIGKIERDFGHKIFFEDERAEVKDDYEALSRVFKNRSLDNEA